MSMSKRVASRYLEARSMYTDLGESGDCGQDKVLERAMLRQVDTSAYKHYIRTKALKPPSDFERAVYPVLNGSDFEFSVRHGLSTDDGQEWGNNPNITISAKLSSHAQHRMDERCISMVQVKRVLTTLVKRLVNAWETKSQRDYRMLLGYLNEGTGGQEFRVGEVKLGLSVENPYATKSVPNGGVLYPMPTGTKFNLLITMAYQRNMLESDVYNAQCIAHLEELGYTLTPKSKWASEIRNAGYVSPQTLRERERRKALGLPVEAPKPTPKPDPAPRPMLNEYTPPRRTVVEFAPKPSTPAPVRMTSEELKTQRCISALSDSFTITPPSP